jgi:hypothetical protein
MERLTASALIVFAAGLAVRTKALMRAEGLEPPRAVRPTGT